MLFECYYKIRFIILSIFFFLILVLVFKMEEEVQGQEPAKWLRRMYLDSGWKCPYAGCRWHTKVFIPDSNVENLYWIIQGTKFLKVWLLGFTGTSKAMKIKVFSVADDVDDGNTVYCLHLLW